MCNDTGPSALDIRWQIRAQRGKNMPDEIQELRDKAAHCRALADAQTNVVAVSQLLALAFEYDTRAERLERPPPVIAIHRMA
jgi:hypothetical protein